MLRETALSSAARNSADYSNGNGPGVQCFFPFVFKLQRRTFLLYYMS